MDGSGAGHIAARRQKPKSGGMAILAKAGQQWHIEKLDNLLLRGVASVPFHGAGR
jgi:hypothetical protein